MRRLNQEEYEKRVQNAHGGNIKVLGEYINRRIKILVRCICGHEWETNPEPITKGHGCPVCAGNKKRTTTDFKEVVFKLTGNEYTVLGKYKGKDAPIPMKHNLCGGSFEMAPNAFMQGQRCPHERYKKSARSNSVPYDEATRLIKGVFNGEYEIIGEYRGMAAKALIRHKKCGKTYRQAPTRIVNGGIGCPFCYLSKGENVIRDYLAAKNHNFKEQVRIRECRHKRPLPFDFGIYGNSDNLLFLIEYDGIQHFSPKFGKKQFEHTQRNDKIKTNFCKKNNIPLIRIKYYRTENPKILKKKLTERLERALLNMTIPSEACMETAGTCND